MHILLGIGFALALLFFWLSAHWFARIVVFLLLAAIGFFSGAVLIGGAAAGAGPELVFGLLGAALAWPIASLPIYHQRRQLRLHIAFWRSQPCSHLTPEWRWKERERELLSQEPVGRRPTPALPLPAPQQALPSQDMDIWGC